MKTLRTIVIAVVFSTLLLQSTFFVASAQNSSATVIVEGNETKTIENGTYSIDQIIVRNSSTLIIQNAKIQSKADYQNWSISLRDTAKLIMINTTILNPSGQLLHSPTRKPYGDLWLTDPKTGTPLPSSNIELDGKGVSSTINNSVVCGAIFVKSGPGSNLSLSNSTIYYIDLHGNRTDVRITNSTALTDYSSMNGSDTVQINNSSFEGLGLNLAASTDLSLRPGLINSWTFHNTISLYNESYDLVIQNTKIESWDVRLSGDGNTTLSVYNSEITYLSNHVNIMRIYSSNITYFDTDGKDYIVNSNITQVNMAFFDKNDFVFDHSIATAFQFVLWTSRPVIFSNLSENATEPRILPEGLFGNVEFANSTIQHWAVAMLEGTAANLEISNSSKIRYIATAGNSHVSIDQTSTAEGIWIGQNGTALIQEIIQLRTPDGTPIRQTPLRLSNNGKTVLEATTDDYGKVFFGINLNANNYTLYTSKLFFEIPLGPSTVDWGNATRRIFLGWTGDVSQPENTTTLNIDSPITLLANWETRYQLKVDSPIGLVNGSGWYRAGTTANFSVTLPQGNILVQEVFTGWTGDSTSSATTAQIVMDSPKAVLANWRLDYTQIYLLFSVIAVIAVIAGVAFVLANRKEKFKPRQAALTRASGKPNPEPPFTEE